MRDPGRELLGRRYVSDFTVLAVSDGEAVLMLRGGDRYALSVEELQALVDSGLLVEMPHEGGGTS